MRARGLIGSGGEPTAVGRALKQRCEDLTDDLAGRPYEALAPAEVDELMVALEPLAARLRAAQG